MIASPTPSANRTAISTHNAPVSLGETSAVPSVNAAHHSTPNASARHGPSRTAIHPASTCDAAYPARNALITQPSLTFPSPNSRLICGPAMVMLVRSRKAMALSRKTLNTSHARIGTLPILTYYRLSSKPGGLTIEPSAEPPTQRDSNADQVQKIRRHNRLRTASRGAHRECGDH